TLSNGFGDSKTIGLTVLDQYGDELDETAYDLDAFVTKPSDFDNGGFVTYTDTDITISTIDKDEIDAGTYTVKVEVSDADSTKVAYVTVSVKKPEATVSYYAIETDKTSYDLKVKSTDTEEKVEIRVFGYDKKGVKVKEVTGEVDITLSNQPDDDGLFEFAPEISGSSIDLVKVDDVGVRVVSGDSIDTRVLDNAVVKAPLGTYRLVAENKINGTAVRSTTFKVVDSQLKPVLSIDDYSSEENDPVEAILDCITVRYDGRKATKDDIIIPDHVDFYQATSYSVRVKKVLYKQNITGLGDLYHEVKVDQTFRYDQ
ncbi:MAG: hypothetical protein GX217_06700, partial [Clostridiaceae bacterium]|nr:hypothetical protein [Clostridiaceae bacterium]